MHATVTDQALYDMAEQCARMFLERTAHAGKHPRNRPGAEAYAEQEASTFRSMIVNAIDALLSDPDEQYWPPLFTGDTPQRERQDR